MARKRSKPRGGAKGASREGVSPATAEAAIEAPLAQGSSETARARDPSAAAKPKKLWRRILTWMFGFVLGAGLVAGALAIYVFYISDDLVFRYTISVRDPRSGRIHVRAEISNHSKPVLRLRRQAGPAHMRIFNFRALTEDGKQLGDRWYGPTRVVYTGFRSKVILEYEIKPGGLGRHGHQGALYPTGGIVPARLLFFLPRDDRDLTDFAVRFETPPGWSTVHAWEPRAGDASDGKGMWFDPLLKGARLTDSLDSSTIGFGRWYSVAKNIGGNRFEVHVWDGFAPDFKARVTSRAVHIFETLQALFHFEFPSKFVAVFVPRAPDGKGIIAGYWSNGLGNEMDDSARTWSLYAHRILHVLNRDHPYGTHLAKHPQYLQWDNPVNWINEGVASFFEVWATVKAGVVASDERYNMLWEDYAKKHQAGSKFVVPLAMEHTNRDEDVTEYLHYYKAPIFTQNMDWWLKQQSGGKKDLAGFISSVYPRYAKHQQAMPFYEELEKYAGFGLKWFFDKYAVNDDILLPLWDDVFQRYGGVAAQAIGRVNGEPLLADAAYRRWAATQGGAQTHRERLVKEKLVEQELRSRKKDALPEAIWPVLVNVPEAWRAMLVRKMREELCYALYGKKGDESERRLDEHIGELRKRAVVQ